MPTIIHQLHQLIRRNEFRPAFTLLDQFIGDRTPYHNQLIQLRGRFNDQVDRHIAGALSETDQILLVNQIREAVLEFLEQIGYLIETEEGMNEEEWAEFRETLITRVVNQKNINYGTISNVGSVSFGDTIHQTVHIPNPTVPKELTASLPRRSRDQLIGRDRELESLRKALLSQQSVCVVNGIGGIGKTSLAEAYVYAHYDDYAHIAWVTQDSEDLLQSFLTARTLQMNLGVPEGITDRDQLFAEVLNRMKALNGEPCLLVLDNAELSAAEFRHQLPQGPKWHVLFTSRHEIPHLPQFPLDHLAPEQALKLFHSFCPDLKEKERIQTLLEGIEYHTLTVELLAKTAFHQMLTMNQLEAALPSDALAGIHIAHSKDKVERVMGYLTRIFDVQGKFDGRERVLLQYWACLPPIFLSLDQLRAVLPEEVYGAEGFGGLLNGLVQRGWLQKGDGRTFKIHRVVADVLWRQFEVSVEEVEPLIERIDGLLSFDDNSESPLSRFPFMPFGQVIVERFREEKSDPIADITFALATLYRHAGDYKNSERFYKKEITIREFVNGIESSKAANAYSNLAIALKYLGRFKEAKEFQEKSVESDEQNFGTDHPITASRYSNLAMLLKHLGDYQGAKELMEKALKSDQSNFGVDHPKTALRYSNLATVLNDIGEYEQAKELMERSISITEKILGIDHPNTTMRYSNLGMVLKNLKDYPNAKILLEKALDWNQKNLGINHPNTAKSYSNLALVLTALGEFARAIELMEKSLSISKHQFGDEHPTTAKRYNYLAKIYGEIKQYPQALKLHKKAISIAKKVLPRGHPSILRYEKNLQELIEIE